MNAIELFAGAGGAALGLEQASIKHAGLYERDEAACATLRAAGLGPVIEGDIREQDFTAHKGTDLLWSSFPCQCWSTAGSRTGARDIERNGWPWTVRAIDETGPRWVICENVRGLLCHAGGEKSCDRSDPMGCPRCYLDQVIMAQLRARYAWADWWLLDAADFGVPQHRRRIFIVAGPRPAAPPQATHGPGMFTKPWKSMGEALGIGGYVKSGQTWAQPQDSAEPSPSVTGAGNLSHLDQPSPTVCTVDGSGLGSAHARDHIEAALCSRRLTPEQCAILQDFPADHPWQGGKTKQYTQIGNAVPPTLARVVAQAILRGEA